MDDVGGPAALTPVEFLALLYGKASGRLALWRLDTKGTKWATPGNIAAIDSFVNLAVTEGYDAYFGVGLQAEAASGRGDAAHVVAVPGVWADIDFLKTQSQKRYPSREAADEMLRRLPLKPTIVVETGGGLHVYWLFPMPWVIKTETDRERLSAACKNWQGMIRARLLKADGSALDSTHDLARILRIPGTPHTKHPGFVVRVREHDGPRWELSQIEAATSPAEAAPANGKSRTQTIRTQRSKGGVVEFAGLTVDAEPPEVKLYNLLEASPEFRAVWERQRTFPSPSEYDQSLANFAAGADWTDNEISRLIIAFRRQHFPDTLAKALRLNYLRRTIAKATTRSPRTTETSAKAEMTRLDSQPTDKSAGDCDSSNHAISTRESPRIFVDNRQLDDLTKDAIGALTNANSPPIVFVRRGKLVRVVIDEEGQARIEEFERTRLRGRLGEVAGFFKRSPKKSGASIAVLPPLPVAETILARGNWDLPPLAGISRSPILRRDGTVLWSPGYDPSTRLLYQPDPALKLPTVSEEPSVQDVGRSIALLLNLIEGFPFADDASRANALALLFSLVMRPVISGNIPLAIVDSPVQGTGKTLLVSALASIAIGPVAAESVPTRQDDAEWHKKITALLLAGTPFVLLDNFPDNSTLDSTSLAAVLTRHSWSDRRLGVNEMIDVPAQAIWAATGNNLRVGGDMTRRNYAIRLDADVERPWMREGFAISNLENFALQHRGELLAAALTIVRAWYVHGQPRAVVPVLGGFDEWASIVGSVLKFAGIGGFLTNIEKTQVAQDDELRQWRAFVDFWWTTSKSTRVTVKELCHLLTGLSHLDAMPLPDVVVQHLSNEASLVRSLGRHLVRLNGRVIGGRKLIDCGEDRNHRRVWQLQELRTESAETP